MHDQDITILKKVKTLGIHTGRLYYYQGNFFFPIGMPKGEQKRVQKSIRLFIYKNKEMIERDRADPAYIPYEKLLDM